MKRAEDFPERHLPRWTCTGQDVGRVIVGVEGVLEVVAEILGAGNVWKSFLFFLVAEFPIMAYHSHAHSSFLFDVKNPGILLSVVVVLNLPLDIVIALSSSR